MMYEVIMAGGGGSRLWPLSRKSLPKQLLKLDGRETMLNETIARMEPLIDRAQAYVVTNAAQKERLCETLLAGVPQTHVLAEPVGRNTAPCILYAALVLQKKYGDGVMCVFPADHYIADPEGLRRTVARAAQAAEETDALVTIGIAPTYAATGYGYIACGEETGIPGVMRAARFVEKPDEARAKQYLAADNYLWNSGVFVWKIPAILRAFAAHLPDMYAAMTPLVDVIGTEKEAAALAAVYPTLESISVDYGIMERSENVCVLAGDYGWSDVGSLDMLPVFHGTDAQGNLFLGDVIGYDSTGCIVRGDKKLIALAGAQDLIVVDTPDALFVCPKARAQDAKKIVELLAEQDRKEQ